MPGIKGLVKAQFSKETTLGTEVNASTLWRGMALLQDESEPVYAEEDVGIIGGVGRTYTPKEDAVIELDETEATFEQLPYLFNMGIRGVAGVQDGAGSGYVYTYPFPTTSIFTPYTYTWELGDNQQAEIMTAVFAEEITISGASEESWMMSGNLRGWIATDPTTTFTGSLAIPAVEEIIFGKTKLYIDAIGGTIGSTQKTNTFLSFELTINNIYQAVWTGDGVNKNFTFIKMNSEPEITLEFTLEHDATSVAERVIRRGRTGRQIRIDGIGSALTTTATHSTKLCRIDLVGTYEEPEEMDEEDGNMILNFKLRNHYHQTPASRGSIVVVNQLSTLP